MKRLFIAFLILFPAWAVQAQNRKYTGNFSLFQQYFNPALTGYEGSQAKSFYRNQWTGFEDAPQTFLVSGELDLADLKRWRQENVLKTEKEDSYSRQFAGQHAFGIAVLQDNFGPFKETQTQFSYAVRVHLSEKLSLRAGAAATYNFQRVDGNKLTLDQANDPEMGEWLGQQVRINKPDVNAGLTLTSEDYYIGYALVDAAKGKFASGDKNWAFPHQHIVQGGYRVALHEQVGLVLNGLYRYDAIQKGTLDVQAKGIFNNTFWAGIGYRNNLAYTLCAGMRLQQFKFGYTFEMPTGDAYQLGSGTHELMLSYNLLPAKHPKFSKKVTLW